MRNRTNIILAKSSAGTALAVVATYCAFFVMRWATGVPYIWLNLVECFAIPIVVGMPILYYVAAQAEELRDARDDLAALHRETDEAYREMRRAHRLLAYAASLDKMTGLLNREAFLERLAPAHAANEPDVLLFVDADHFKQINDRLGHLKGDEALVKIASAIKRAVRKCDVVGRIGGEEFGVLLKNVDLASAAEIAEAIREQVNAVQWQPNMALTVSIGGAALHAHSGKMADVLTHADRCLYAAKRAGRNRVAFECRIVRAA
ncbi:Diguanylate cyclase DgcM [Rhizobiaceae bacterium]|nr:Diguanylate cyclase DgcM [Rhizobiaceae bacterium]